MGERGKSKMESGKFCKAVSRVLQGRGQPGPALCWAVVKTANAKKWDAAALPERHWQLQVLQ